MTATPPSLRFDPEPSGWAGLIATTPLTEEQRLLRAQLRLPTDRPLILSGHQPTIWHPGILAKHLAATALAESIDAHAAWLVIEHVEIDAHTIDYPADPESPKRARLPLAPPSTDQTIAMRTPAIRAYSESPESPASPAMLDGVARGASRILASLAAHDTAVSLAEQFTLAINDLLVPIAPPFHAVFTSRLIASDLFAQLVDRMRASPVAASKTHNDALRAVPDTGVSPLAIDEQDPAACEIPLWVIRHDGSRRKAFASDLAALPPEQFAPRVLFNTGIARLAGCDLFIHGAGGAAYDRATEHWFRAWLGRELAPAVLATADMFLPLVHESTTHDSLDRTRWALHHARHNPMDLGDAESGAAKADLLEQIRAAREAGQCAEPLYRKMHELLDAYRAAHAHEFQTLRVRVREAERNTQLENLACDRSWAFPLYPREQLDLLADSIRGCFQSVCCSTSW